MNAGRWVVRGDGLAGWAAAAALASELPTDAEVIVVGSGEPDAGSLCVATMDADSLLLRVCDRPAGEVLVAAGGGFTLGTKLSDWNRPGATWVCPQEPLPPFGDVAIHDLVLATATGAGRREDYAGFLAPLRFQARVAEVGRYAEPAADRASPRSLLRPGIAVDTQRLTDLLKARAVALGVTVAGEEPTGDIRLVVDTRRDAGSKAWQDEGERLGFDRIATGRRATTGPHPPHLTSSPLPSGHRTVSPVAGGERVAVAWGGDDAGLAEAMAGLDDVTVERSRPGWSDTPWQGDTVVIGPAAACLGPLFGQDFTLLDRQLQLLVDLLPSGAGDRPACAAEYNRRHLVEVGHRRDLVHLALRRCARAEGWWADRRAAPPSATLTRRLQQFQLRNRSVAVDGDPFDAALWLSTLAALGYVPRAHDPRADRLDPRRAAGHLGQTVQAFDATLAAMPSHDEVLAKLSEPPADYEWPDFDDG